MGGAKVRTQSGRVREMSNMFDILPIHRNKPGNYNRLSAAFNTLLSYELNRTCRSVEKEIFMKNNWQVLHSLMLSHTGKKNSNRDVCTPQAGQNLSTP